MSKYFKDIAEGERFTSEGKTCVKGKHRFYKAQSKREIPPNAHDPDNPHLYLRFGPMAMVDEQPTDKQFLAQDARAIQHQLAEQCRQATGHIPHGQLWQPCKHPGCDREPVCMNCMNCQDIHCHCFD